MDDYRSAETLMKIKEAGDDPTHPSICTRYFTLYSLLPDLRNKTILDVPCGFGKMSRKLVLEYGASKVIAVDIVEKQIEISKREDSLSGIQPGQIVYIAHDAKKPVVLTDTQCDVCVNVHLLCFAENYSELKKMCHCIYLNLKQGGKCYSIMCTLNRDSQLVGQLENFDQFSIISAEPWEENKKCRRFRYKDRGFTHDVHVWDSQAVCSAFNEVGFASVEIYPLKSDPDYRGNEDLELFTSIIDGNVIVAKK